MPKNVYESIAPDLERFGDRVNNGTANIHANYNLFDLTCCTILYYTCLDIAKMGDNAETHPPTLRQYDPWCRRVDELDTSEGWHQLKSVAVEEG
jgi:hypothetical protein